MKGRFGDLRQLLARPQLFMKRKDSSVPHQMELLRFLQGNDTLQASYLDLFDPQLDPSVPGLLAAFALSGASSHKVPALLRASNSKLP